MGMLKVHDWEIRPSNFNAKTPLQACSFSQVPSARSAHYSFFFRSARRGRRTSSYNRPDQTPSGNDPFTGGATHGESLSRESGNQGQDRPRLSISTGDIDQCDVVWTALEKLSGSAALQLTGVQLQRGNLKQSPAAELIQKLVSGSSN